MEYKTIITTAGAEKIADCILRGEKLNISSAAAGDGGGAPYIPSADQTALVNERWRGEISSAGVNPNEPNMLDVKVVIHSADTEFIVRELGLYDDDGALIAVTNTPETQKALPENGASNKLTFIVHLVVADGSAVSFTINATLAGVTAEEMAAAIDLHNKSTTAHPDMYAPKSHLTATNPHGITPSGIGAAPAYTYGTEDLEAGVSALATGKLYFVYE